MKKIIYIVLLIIVVVAIVLLFVLGGNFKSEQVGSNQIAGMRSSNENTVNEVTETKVTNTGRTQVTKLSDGTLYSFNGKQEKADVVIGDNYFDTQINEIMLNYSDYVGKTVEIEGMYIDVYNPYTVVGRFSTSNLCPYCPVGYSAFEYTWKGEKINVKNEETWIKVIGKFCVGNDASSNYQDYYYIEASSIEVMNESGLKTVSN